MSDAFVQLEHVNKKYGDRTIIDDLSFQILKKRICGYHRSLRFREIDAIEYDRFITKHR